MNNQGGLMKVTYFNHSGFLVETENKVLIFDYYPQGKRFDFFDPKDYKGKDIIFFVSHNHSDHFDTRILDWVDSAAYVISHDITLDAAFSGEALYVKPHETYQFHGLTIETLLSNDEGVAFIVQADGKAIYHGGDLNWWHWDEEPADWNEDMAARFKHEIALIKSYPIDIAFLTADPRQEAAELWGISYFLEQVETTTAFPMHFGDDYSIMEHIRDQSVDNPNLKKINLLSVRGQHFELMI